MNHPARPIMICRCCGSRFHPPAWMGTVRPTCGWCRKASTWIVQARIARFGADHALAPEAR